jgi:hypothetical protein
MSRVDLRRSGSGGQRVRAAKPAKDPSEGRQPEGIDAGELGRMLEHHAEKWLPVF